MSYLGKGVPKARQVMNGSVLFSHIWPVLSVGTHISIRGSMKNYSTMKTNASETFEKRPDSMNSRENGRKHKNYYTRFLELMARKTDSEKRMQVFGSDPFK